ncbi:MULTISPECIES: efflux RND transporter periplasmic adaptor subunit [unclassified Flavobacterium]|uniref:efflux RND transporter periplasmic adaptor subunit n=1 Tax=unclassified Flavobacterium TaxID=196869 RepID=UPI000962C618|nr:MULTISPECIES: efflux RND transporter periplasmic adaptor subunit [unclassified Flavobacterium]MBN9285480.1 efflux RND transporter periplasmic adaptor subunit [Flavobacterium sp.]OJV71470.1 MAG: efflux transporter periplasmic adaptor subunit [Flavobacterium sp. 40-81]
MKKSNLIYLNIAGLTIIGLVLYFALRHTHTEGDGHEHGTEKTTGKEAATVNKEVELNEAQFKAANVELGTYALKNLSEVINANGYTKLPPQNQADVSVHMPGVVKTITVIEGQYVRKGQVLATIESPEFTKLQEAYLTSKSNLEFLSQEFNRQKTLSEEEVNSKKVFQKTKAEYQIEKARFNSLQKQLGVLNIQSGNTAVTSVPVLAPISGYTTEINVKIGSNVEVGKPILSIVDNSKLHVDLLVYEKDLHKVKQGQNVQLVLTNQNNTAIKGTIFSVGKAFENETKSVAVHADINNEKNALIPGMYVNALIDIGTNAVQSLPVEAIVKADGREFMFVLEEGHEEAAHDSEKGHSHEDGHQHDDNEGKTFHFQRVEIKTGTSQLGYIQVTPLQKIDPKAKIVLKGAYYLQSHLIKNEGGGGHSH